MGYFLGFDIAGAAESGVAAAKTLPVRDCAAMAAGTMPESARNLRREMESVLDFFIRFRVKVFLKNKLEQTTELRLAAWPERWCRHDCPDPARHRDGRRPRALDFSHGCPRPSRP